jgi:quercetin dioxygenase-like cupin family protein
MTHVIRALGAWLLLCALPALSQAPSRPCSVGATPVPGPACLLAKVELGNLTSSPVYWHLYVYPTAAKAQAELTPRGIVVEEFGRRWLFTIAEEQWRPLTGELIAKIGPLPLKPAASFTAEYLRSIFEPGSTAPLHIHSGPEAFFALTGDTCLETPDGVQTSKGPGNTLVIAGGPPMLLMATGSEIRKGFALILHDSAMPPTTLVDDWRPKGLCRKDGLPSSGRDPAAR